MSLQPDEVLERFAPDEDPPFFNILVEKRHAHMLQHPSLDKESRLEVIYRVLKDQLKRAKCDLLSMK